MATFTESFNKADSDTLGPDLTWTEQQGDVDVVSNQADLGTTVGGQGIRHLARAEHDTGSADMYVEAVIAAVGSFNYLEAQLSARHSTTDQTYYALRRGYSTSENAFYAVYRVVAGAETVLLARTSLAFSFPETWKLEVTGTNPVTLKVYRGGAQQGSTISDSDAARITTGQRGGIGGYRSTSGAGRVVQIDSFATGSVVTGPTVNAGTDQTATAGDTVTLTATASDGGAGTFAWTRQSGDTYTLTGASTATATYTPTAAGSTTWLVTYTPTAGAPVTDTVTVTHNLPSPPVASYTRATATVIDASGSTADTTLTETSAHGVTITETATDVYEVEHPSPFDTDLVLSLVATDAYAQTDTETITITPAGGAGTVVIGPKVKVGGVYV